MQKKIVGILVGTLLIAAAVLPVAGTMNVITDNSPPNKPIVTVPEKVTRGKLFTVDAVSSDPDGDAVYYRDEFMGCAGRWIGPYPSGQKYSYKIFLTVFPGTYTLGVQAKDINEAESEWTYVQFNVTKNKAINTPFLNFLQQYLNLFPILRLLFQRLGLR
jgi:hypothetical protein